MIIDYNPNNLEEKDVEEYVEKVRLLIKNDKDEILVANYGGAYLLPGGKIDGNESVIEALKREINEEVGLDIDESLISLVTTFNYYQKDYPKRNGKVLNRKVTTHYYKTNMNIDLSKYERKLTQKEVKGNFKLEWIKEENLKDVIKNNPNIKDNSRVSYMNDELLKVLDVYNKNHEEEKSSFDISNKVTKMYLKSEEQEFLGAMNTLNRLYNDTIIEPYINSEKIIDLHTHTNYSDGDLSPNELIKLAIDNNVGTLGITDHDTICGIKEINRDDSLIIDSGINIINGIELSAKTQKGRMHILGYDFDVNDKDLNDKMNELKKNSIYSVMAIINQLKIDYGIAFDSLDINELFSNLGNIGRPHVAKLLIKYGYVKDVKEAFNKYLTDAYKKTKILNKGIPYKECISLIKKADGISVLAHPNQLLLNDEELEEKIKEMISVGLDGIEVYHSGHSKEETKKYLEIANKYNLLISGGSDYHGKSVKPDVDIGKTSNGKIKRLSLLSKIK